MILTHDRSEEEALDDIARQILLVDRDDRSLVPQYKAILTDGLPRCAPDQGHRVLILGAGIAGMLAGKLLKDAGYAVTILEANPNRVGGRVKTFHSVPGEPSPFSDPALYAEAGAMRIPTTHPLVNRLIDVLGLTSELQLFYNVAVEKTDPTAKTFRTWLRCNGIQVRQADYNAGILPDSDGDLGFPLKPTYRHKTADALFSAALTEVRALVDVFQPIAKQIEGWKTIIREYDDRSMYQFLTEHYSDATVRQYIGTLENLTSRFFLSFFHSFLDTFFINSTATYHEIRGGNWRMADALMSHLEKEIVMDARAVAIHWEDGRPIRVRTLTEAELRDPQAAARGREFEGDTLIIAIPFSSLRHVTTTPLFSYPKRRAIAELHYDNSTKVLLEFSKRFWEWDETTWKERLGTPYRGHDSVGGSSTTDEPNRFIYFPSHPVNGDSRGGVVLASYSWADDAVRWDPLTPDQRAFFALDGLARIYGESIRSLYTGHFQTQSWMEDPYACGEAVVFSPGEVMELQVNIPTREGRVHFAGEHTSMKHAWIEGAVESAIRAALEVNGADAGPGRTKKTEGKHGRL
ncbi:flavin monoamine oxidase family protein [Sorangium sp. So ce118]